MANITGTSGNDILDGTLSGDNISGLAGNDVLNGNDGSDTLIGGAGNDTLNGGAGTDDARYWADSPTRGIQVNLAAGTVIDGLGGSDTLTSVESISGTTPSSGSFSDAYTAVGFGWSTSARNIGSSGAYNSFWGGRGSDSVIGNGYTRINFEDSANTFGGVTVDLVAGTARLTTSNASYPMNWALGGGIYSIRGTSFADILKGGDPTNGSDTGWSSGFENFEPMAGNDLIIGGFGYDKVSYNTGTNNTGINVNMNTGSVVGDPASQGTDTLSGIEGIQGTNLADRFSASDLGLRGTNVSVSTGWFSSFEGMGGDDIIVGNGDTRIEFGSAAAAIKADLRTGISQDLGIANGTSSSDTAGVGRDIFTGVNSVRGSKYNDSLIGGNILSDQLEIFEGGAGNDFIDGRGGWDRAKYDNDINNSWKSDGTTLWFAVDNTGQRIYKTGITVDMANGIVTGDPTVIGTDTLRSVENVWGTVLNDTYDARGFSGTSVNAGSKGLINEFHGGAGDDTVIGNGFTRVSYFQAAAAVHVDLSQGFATSLDTSSTDKALIGRDSLTGVNAIRGGQFDDLLVGGLAANDLFESFEGRQGNDTLSGGSGFDRARYDKDGSVGAWLLQENTLIFLNDGNANSSYAFKTGVQINMAAGTVVGDVDFTGSDTLRSIESVYGTVLADRYDATGFSGLSTNAGSSGTFNEFQGGSGNDTVIGNGNTRINYVDAMAGVYINMVTGSSYGIAAGDRALVGTDTFTGVNSAKGSQFGDTIIANNAAWIDAQAGDDAITVSSGNDIIDGGDGLDTVIFQENISAVTSIGRSVDGVSLLISTSYEGLKTLNNVEYVKFGSANALSISDFVTNYRPAPLFSSVKNDENAAKSTGLDMDEGSSLDSSLSVEPKAISNSSYVLPEKFTGDASLRLDYQLINNDRNAVITGASSNDFIKVASTNSTGKAVDGGGGSDVIDGGVGSTFVSGGTGHSGSTFFLDGRAPGISWSTITDFKTGLDQATIWGFVKGVSSVDTSFTDPNNEGAGGIYSGLTLHFKNLLPDGQATGTNADLNSITFSGRTLADIGVSSLQDLNNQINKVTTANEYGQYVINDHLIIGQTQDAQGTHGYLFVH